MDYDVGYIGAGHRLSEVKYCLRSIAYMWKLPLKRQSGLQKTTVLNIFHCFSDKIMLDVSSESSAWQRIHMKYQALFLRKMKVKIIKVSSAAILLGALRVKLQSNIDGSNTYGTMKISSRQG